ncbi:MAG TPA: hypothetical protein ENI87_01660 [bacterium]|nr:hypothetical protein [bacterium]
MGIPPKGQMLHVFFQDLEPGPFPLRISAELGMQYVDVVTNATRIEAKVWLVTTDLLQENGRSGEIELCRGCPDHLA